MAKAPPPFRVQIVTDSRLAYFREAVIGARRFGFETGRLEFVDRWLEPELRGDLGRLVRRDRVAGIVAPLHTIAEERRYARLAAPAPESDSGRDRKKLNQLYAPTINKCSFLGVIQFPFSGSQLKGIRQQLPPIRSIQLSGSIGRLWRPLRTCRPLALRNSTRARSLTSNAFFRARSRPGLREGAGFFFSGRLCYQSVPKKPATYDAGAPGGNRTHIYGFGDRYTIHCATGA